MARARILIVENEDLVAEHLRATVEHLGYVIVAVVSTGEAAIEKAADTQPDLVLVDVELAGQISGIEAAHRIYARFNIPVIFLSASPDSCTGEAAQASEPYGCLVKPLKAADVKCAVEIALCKHKAATELRESEVRYRSLFENMRNAVAVYRAVRDGEDFVIADLNRSAENLERVQRADVMGKSVLTVFPWIKELGLLEVLARVWRTGTPEQYPIVEHKDTEIHLWRDYSIYKLPSGEIVAVYGDDTEGKKAEEALWESQRMLAAILAAVPVGIGLARNRKIQWANEAWMKMFGFTEESQYIGHSVRELCRSDEDYEAAAKILYSAPETGAVKKLGLKLRRHDGSLFDAVMRVTPLHPSDPSKGFLATVTDISDRKRVIEALGQSEGKYRATFNNAAVGIDLVDSDGRFIQVNDTLAHFLGYTQQELEGLTILDVTHPEDSAKSKEMYDALVRGETESYRLEKRYIRKDGAVVWADTSVSAIRGPNGMYRATVGVIVDITQRRKAEEMRLRMATAVEQAAETIEITDANGTIAYVNPAFERTTGYSREEAVGKNPRILKSGQHEDEFYRQMWETIVNGGVWTGRIVNRKKDGTFFEEEATISPIKDDRGNIVSFVAVKRDVTKEVSLQAQLLQAQKMEAIGTLAGGIAHDFNNLLQVTLGYSELLLADRDEGDPAYADLFKIFQAARSGSELVRRLLTFSRKVEPQPIPLNLNNLLRHVEKLLRRTIPRMIDIELNLSEDIAEINADPTQMQQVLMNLAVNARDAMPDGGKLTIETSSVSLDDDYCDFHVGVKPGQWVLLSVSDTGHGMDKATLDHIFEPFYTTKELGRGTGLGLAMVYGIVNQHHGHITCYSEIGHGTTFKVYLPAVRGPEEPEPDQTAIMPAFGSETILIVDDEEFVRDLGARILTKAGYTVLQATDGVEALEVYELERSRISLVLLDLIMPGKGGRECLKDLLKIDPQARVLVASGYSADASVRDCLALGAKGFVSKPFRIKELLRLVRSALDDK